jgi:hypothetical protein
MHQEDERTPDHLKAFYPRFRTRGITGTQLSGGKITGKEQNAKLTGLNWINEAENMLATDPIVKRSWYMLRQTLLSAKWRFEAGVENDPVAEELANFANEAFGFDGYAGQMSVPWEEQLSYLLEFIPIGYRYAEEIYRVGPCKDGKIKVWLDYYADREPSAHNQWLSRDGQNLDGVTQNQVGVTYTPEPIPANKLLLLTLNRTGSNFEGVGMLRPIWWFWRTKQRASNLMCVALERWALPTPKIVIDRSEAEMQGLTDSDLNKMYDEAIDQAEAFLATEQSYLMESPVIKFDSYGVTPNLYSQGPLDIIKECDNQISQGFFAQFANLGISDTGSRSVGEVHHSFFRRAAINLCDIVAGQVSGVDRRGGGTIGRLIRWNFGAVDPSKLPRLTHTGLDTDDLADSLGMLPNLVQSGLLTADDDLERAIRQRLGAGELPELAERSPLERSMKSKAASFAEILANRKGRENG